MFLLQLRIISEKNAEYMDRIEKQNMELSSLSSKLRESLAAQSELNDEVNEKTDDICLLHKTKSKYIQNSAVKCSKLYCILFVEWVKI